jgi:hypothetical protein
MIQSWNKFKVVVVATRARRLSATTNKDPTAASGGGGDTVWERTARKVKDTNKDRHNAYMEAIRATHDPAWQVQTIEDELKATIGQALGRQGRKLLTALHGMQREWQHYQELGRAIERNSALLTTVTSSSSNRNQVPNSPANSTNTTGTDQPNHVLWDELHKSVERYNALRQLALTARWELMVQRQAAGLVVNNHAHVTRHYPIPAALPLPSSSSSENFLDDAPPPLLAAAAAAAAEPPPEAPLPAQKALDWWQRVGRWK